MKIRDAKDHGGICTSSLPSSSPSSTVGTAACTIIARNYLPQARVLAASFCHHHPSSRFYCLVIDGLPEGYTISDGSEILDLRTLRLPDEVEMCFKYDVTELSTAVKPTFLRLLISERNEDTVIYFDPDILIQRPLVELFDALSESDIVLTPHLLDPIPDDGCQPTEAEVLVAGAYNLGFLAVRRSDTVSRFLDWWEAHLVENCRFDIARGLFVDQKWVDLVPGLFQPTCVLRDPTYNVAYWNIHSRELTRDGESYFVNDRPLAFYHFSGFNPQNPSILSKHPNRTSVKDAPVLGELLRHYRNLLVANGSETTRRWQYGFGHFDDGGQISTVMRKVYQELDPSARKSFGNPFETSNRLHVSFRDWAVKRRCDGDRLAPLLSWFLARRPDLLQAFPDPYGMSREGFRNWLGVHGLAELGIGPELLDGESRPGTVDGQIVESANKRNALHAFQADQPFGVNVCGYLRSEDGIGAVARGFVDALRFAGVPFSLRDVSSLSPQRAGDNTLTQYDDVNPYNVNLVCVNADQHFVVKSHLPPDYFSERYNVAVWFWELPEFPQEWHKHFHEYDEIWVASSFVEDALAPISPIPVIRMPPVITANRGGDRTRGRQNLGFADNTYVFLFIFDFNSFIERKNPEGTIKAFAEAFTSDDSVHFVIKTVNGEANRDGLERLKEISDGLAITVIDGYWTAEQIQDLTAACDAYVSLHRSEGFGVTIADAMLHEKPVIATDWSANTDFLNVTNGFPVRYRLVSLTEDHGPYRAGQIWAEPDIQHAAELMRFVYQNREEAAERGRRASSDIQASYSQAVIARRVAKRLGVIEDRLRKANNLVTTSPVRESRPIHADEVKEGKSSTANGNASRVATDLRPAALPPMNLDHSLYGPIGTLAKRGVAFLLAYHTYYQQQVNDTLITTVNALIADRNAMQHQLQAALDEITKQQVQERLRRGEIEFRVRSDARRQEHLERRVDEVAALAQSKSRIDDILKRLSQVEARFAARPYMSSDEYQAFGDLDRPLGYSLDAAELSDGVKDFATLFCGEEDVLAARKAVYLPFVRGRKRVVDLGCGRGEFLRLLRDEGVVATGVEMNPALVARLRGEGLDVIEGDAIEFLSKQPEGSLDVIFSAQVVEHLEFNDFTRLIELAKSRLRVGGQFIAETVNPECFEAMKAFFVDLTHQRPIFPQVFLNLCQTAGFRSARIFYPAGGGFTQECYQTAGEYAVVAIT